MGTFPTILKQSASVGTRFCLYNYCKECIGPENIGVGTTMAVGALVGGLSTFLNHPIDVIKSRMQADARGLRAGKYRGVVSGLGQLPFKRNVSRIF